MKRIIAGLWFVYSSHAFAFDMAAIGDSLTTGYNAFFWRDNHFLSWSTGNAPLLVNSHYQRLRKIYGDVHAYNVAQAGAKLGDLMPQIDDLIPQIDQLKGKNLDYITIMSGTNDVCRWPDSYEEHLMSFDRHYHQLVNRALAEHPQAKLLLVPIPDLNQLHDVGVAKGCSWKWKILLSCTPLTRADATPASSEAFRERVNRTNEVIENVAAEHADRVRYAASLNNIVYTPEHLDHKDCSHPSLAGQNAFAAATWADSWYVQKGE